MPPRTFEMDKGLRSIYRNEMKKALRAELMDMMHDLDNIKNRWVGEYGIDNVAFDEFVTAYYGLYELRSSIGKQQ